MVIADILEHLDDEAGNAGKPDINAATIDELEALLSVNRNIAKEIFKYRIKEGYLDLDSLSKINGIGPKTLKKAEEEFLIDE